MTLDVVILAAGQGSRMRSKLPKVLHNIAGKSMLQHVVDTTEKISADNIHIVIGHGADKVKTSISNPKVQWAIQAEQLGTGHAVNQALPAIAEQSKVLILYGDVPLISEDTLQRMLNTGSDTALTLLTVNLTDPTGYGRIIRNSDGKVVSITEQKDASPTELDIKEVNTGIMCTSAVNLKRWLPQLKDNNAQSEYYLTDIVSMAVGDDVDIAVCHASHPMEVQGANNRQQLQQLERYYQLTVAEELMASGATLADANRIDVRGTLQVGEDVTIDVNCIFEGDVQLADGVHIGPNCHIINSTIASHCEVKTNTVIEGAVIAEQCTVGPFARIRPGSVLASGVKIGNFVETKKANIRENSKVSHLSYIGDADIGKDVNIGAGTITCNYDGVNKFNTVIDDNAFVGSNTALVAPVHVGKTATIGAGSTITGDIAEGDLAVARAKQRNIKNWIRPEKNSRS
ncbi:Bifunctional protein GlmU [Zhongshania aliphaticivorans]|uniref:Bifunctional protein GlmU n=1 Tax=Zhongshania aliphaticivorans TaxID=1470434 RepID=A0A5S9PJS0_9GAMM|nr:bifunctional UDP-N-acetylglucosamine diphosphorylase/glucosamine-1-phosphate N-acetyltransferase GlmU [Zhongshania aliphaticivorans]CAA0104263.1 Bifunctional protein GlmU [Zhongshania aliphaticivorans]CAA0104470.1 Bifunctional protein GlmU [Zhongshania aliphaticivorans]